MGEIEKMDAFSVVVKYLDSGNVATAKKPCRLLFEQCNRKRNPTEVHLQYGLKMTKMRKNFTSYIFGLWNKKISSQ